MAIIRLSDHAGRRGRRGAAAPVSGSLRRAGRALAAAQRRHGGTRASLTARLMGDPPPGRSALERRTSGGGEAIAADHEQESGLIFAGPAALIEPGDPYDDPEAAMLTDFCAEDHSGDGWGGGR